MVLHQRKSNKQRLQIEYLKLIALFSLNIRTWTWNEMQINLINLSN